MRITNREKRDWTLIIFIIPIGIILMMIAGQIAVRIVPQWSVNAGMKSLLDPQTAPKQQVGFVQPVLPEIFTPLGWFDTFLTPNANSGGDIAFPPFVVFEPTATPSPTASPEEPSPTVTKTPTTPAPSPTTVTTVPSATQTKKPPVDEETPVPPTKTPVTPTATPPTVTPPPVTSTIDPSLTELPPPPEIGLTPDGNPGEIMPGNYVIVNLGGNPVVVVGASETNYDLVYYESNAGGNVLLDRVIVGISQWTDLTLPGSVYYEVFNWGDNIRDTNTNVDTNTLRQTLAVLLHQRQNVITEVFPLRNCTQILVEQAS